MISAIISGLCMLWLVFAIFQAKSSDIRIWPGLKWMLPLGLCILFALAHIFFLNRPVLNFYEYIQYGAYHVMAGKLPYRDFYLCHGILFPYFNGFFLVNFGWIPLKAAYLICGVLGLEIYRRYLSLTYTQETAILSLIFVYTMPVFLAAAFLGQNEFLMLPFVISALSLTEKHPWLKGILLGLGFCMGSLVILGIFLAAITLMKSWERMIKCVISVLLTVVLINLPCFLRSINPFSYINTSSDLLMGQFSTIWGVIRYNGGSYPYWAPLVAMAIVALLILWFSRRFQPKLAPVWLVTVFLAFSSFDVMLHADHCLLILPIVITWLVCSDRPQERLALLLWLTVLTAALLQEVLGPKGYITQLAPRDTFLWLPKPLALIGFLVIQFFLVYVGFKRIIRECKPAIKQT